MRGRLTAVGALAAAAALVLSGCANQGGEQTQQNSGAAPAPATPAGVVLPAGDGQGRCAPGTSIAYIGTIQGDSPALGEPVYTAARLAVAQHNQANPGCQVTLKEFDSGGAGATALGPTTAAINDPSILGVVGLPFSGESKAVGGPLEQAGLVHISPSATNPGLAANGWKTFFRGLANDNVQGAAVAKFIRQQFNPQSVCVIRDDSEYGIGLADVVTQQLGPQVAACQDQVKSKQAEFSATSGKVQQANPQVVFYSGYYPEAGPLIDRLKQDGVQATVVGPDGVKDPAFITAASGAPAEGTYFSCPCVPTDGFTDFTNAYTQQSGGKAPGTYAGEAYDLSTILLQGIDKGAADRPALLNFVRNYDGQGLTKRFKWQPDGELTETPMWSYKVVGGQIVRDRPLT